MKLPTKYAAARKALALAASVDEVKEIRNQAVAMETYAFQVRDPDLIAPSAEIKLRATEKIGEIMEKKRQAGELAKGGEKYKKSNRGKIAPVVKTLAEQNVDKHLAKNARKLAAMSRDKFEELVAKRIRLAIASVSGNNEVIKEARAERHQTRQQERSRREKEWAGKVLALPTKRYGVIYADPEWQFKFYSEKGKTNSSADNHYDTSPLEEIKARDVGSISAKDCVLFLWATAPMMPHAVEVMLAWGFEYKSQCIWRKSKAGTGYWFRNQHELLLVGTKGKIVAPADGTQFPSVIDAPVTKHSAKPPVFYEVIERYFPNVPKVELNARAGRKGWDSWGHEAPSEAAE
jgi:N6-adenosine-specific RNA methylase IME4